jgi:heme exporter protein D
MNWSSAGEFFAMGGYGLYVWGSYGVVTAWMLLEPIAVMRRQRRALHQINDNEEQDN